MNNISVFQFDDQEIRFVNGQPVAIDVAKVLGYKSPADTVRQRVDEEYKGVEKISTPGGTQSVVVLKEPGIYQLIFSSKLTSAKKFQSWVFEEVLPAIRKTGQYQRKAQPVIESKSPEWVQGRLQGKDERRKLTDAIKEYIDRHPELSDNRKKFMYSNASEALNLSIFAKRSKQLKALLGLSNNALLRDGLTLRENSCLASLEFLACQLIEHEDLDPCVAVKKAIDTSYSHQMFAEKYLNNDSLPSAKD